MFERYIAWEQKSLIGFPWTTVPVNKRSFSISLFELQEAISQVNMDVPQDVDIDFNKCITTVEREIFLFSFIVFLAYQFTIKY